jgi:hypothetical protein
VTSDKISDQESTNIEMNFGPIERRGSKLGPCGFSAFRENTIMPYIRILACGLWPAWSKTQAQMTKSLKLKRIPELIPFKWALTCLILTNPDRKNLSYTQKSIFFGKWFCVRPGLQGHRSQIPDQTVELELLNTP